MSCNFLTETGEILITELGEMLAPDGICITIDQDVTWQTSSYVTKDLNIFYDVGQGILKWYRVQGTCVPCAYNNNCESTGLQVLGTQCLAGTTGSQFYIQNILATSVTEVCQILKDSQLGWEVCTIKVYSKPADPNLSSPDETCNTLSDVPFENLPECLPVYVNEKSFIAMKMGAYAIESNFEEESAGGIVVGGTAVVTGSTGSGSNYEYVSSGLPTLVVGSLSEYNSSWDSDPNVEMYMDVSLTYFEADLNTSESGSTLMNASSNIRTVCGACTSMPSLFYLFNNLETTVEITNFVKNNPVTFPDKILMRYNKKTKSWNGNYQVIGNGNLGQEKWNFVFNWYCRNVNAEDYVSPFWKFSIFINKYFIESNVDLDTKIHITFPPDYLCEQIDNLNFDFSFNLNTTTKYVSSNFVNVIEDVILYDNIGLFKNNSWKSNPTLEFNFSSQSSMSMLENVDLTPIIP